jgi:hypothetical protein
MGLGTTPMIGFDPVSREIGCVVKAAGLSRHS